MRGEESEPVYLEAVCCMMKGNEKRFAKGIFNKEVTRRCDEEMEGRGGRKKGGVVERLNYVVERRGSKVIVARGPRPIINESLVERIGLESMSVVVEPWLPHVNRLRGGARCPWRTDSVVL